MEGEKMLKNLALRDIIIAFVILVLAGILNASMDLTKQTFNQSVFSKWSEPGTDTYKYLASHWTNKWQSVDYPFYVIVEGDTVSWQTKDYQGETIWFVLDKDGNREPRWFLGIEIVPFNHPLFFDSWHLFKTLMIAMLICYGMVLYYKPKRVVFAAKQWWDWVVAFILFLFFGLVWNLSFNLFYDNILRL
jgi:hypothetical protein